MVTVGEVYKAVDEIAPFRLAEKWDNSGLLTGNRNDIVSKAMVCLDITKKVAMEAVEKGANVIISHHPVIFNPLKSIDNDSLIAYLIKNNISAICAHTNFDIAQGGINDIIARKLNLEIIQDTLETVCEIPYYQLTVFVPVDNIEQVYQAMVDAGAGTLGNYKGCAFYTEGIGTFIPLEGSHAYIGEVGEREKVTEARLEMILPQDKRYKVIKAMLDAHPYEKPAYHLAENYAIMESKGYGKVGELPAELTPKLFAQTLKRTFGNTVIRYNDAGKNIKRIAFCSGSGGSFLNNAVACGADAYVTGDVKHDVFMEADNIGISLFDAGHFHTENIAIDSLKERLVEKLPNIKFLIPQENKDILSYEIG